MDILWVWLVGHFTGITFSHVLGAILIYGIPAFVVFLYLIEPLEIAHYKAKAAASGGKPQKDMSTTYLVLWLVLYSVLAVFVTGFGAIVLGVALMVLVYRGIASLVRRVNARLRRAS